MREILFRGKRVDNYVKDSSVDYAEKGVGEWVYGDIIHRRYYKNRDVIVIRTEDSGFDNYSDYEVDPETLGQYTGLTDKNGKKIFEGDICRFDNGEPDESERYTNYAVQWDCVNCRYVVVDGYNCDDCLDIFFAKHAEVIGNIHDNPELLEVT